MMDENQAYLKALQEEVEKKAKRANQRLRQIEDSGVKSSSRAYQVTVRKAKDNQPGYVTTAKGNIAFDRRLKDKTIAQLEAELAELDRFLEVHTSTVRGYKKQLRKSFEGFLKTTGRTEVPEGVKSSSGQISFEEYQQLFEMEATKTFGYDTIQAIQRETGEDLETIETALDKAVKKQARMSEVLGEKNLIEYVEHPERFKKNGDRRIRNGVPLTEDLEKRNRRPSRNRSKTGVKNRGRRRK